MIEVLELTGPLELIKVLKLVETWDDVVEGQEVLERFPLVPLVVKTVVGLDRLLLLLLELLNVVPLVVDGGHDVELIGVMLDAEEVETLVKLTLEVEKTLVVGAEVVELTVVKTVLVMTVTLPWLVLGTAVEFVT